MGFGTAVRTCFSKYLTFSGRARRPEYWWFFLFIVLGSVIATFIDGAIFGIETTQEPATQIASPVFSLATFLPLLAVGWRRLHDSGRPGWYLLIPLTVSVAMILALMLGVFGVAHLEATSVDQEAVRAGASGLGMASLGVAGIVQLVLAGLILWWLTRPTQAGPNRYGDEPPLAR